MKKLTLYILVLIYSSVSFSSEYLNQWKSPLYDDQSKKVLLYGSSAVVFLVAFRDQTIEKFQDDVSTHKPLGDFAPLGDYSGMLVPNLIYAGYMAYDWKSRGNKESKSKMMNMIEASAYAGITTGILKRIVNQKRPHGGDRLSFPSGHTTTAFAFATTVALEHPEWKYEAFALATFAGFSRINDNQHYLHDVVMGATIGSAFAISIFNRSKAASDSYTLLPVIMPDYISYNYIKSF